MPIVRSLLGAMLLLSLAVLPARAADQWKSLFNGHDLTGWKAPEGDNGHWKVVDGVIDYDACSEAAKDKNLWTADEYGDFEFEFDWRFKQTTGEYPTKIILPDGSYKLDDDGKPISVPMANADSGVYLRGLPKAQVNLWCWPIGSGEIWGFRNDKEMPAEVRAGCVPKVCADNPVGQWNQMSIAVKGDRVTVHLNGKLVIDNVQLPGLPAKGAIGLQHHGGLNKKTGEWSPASALIQFRNLRIKSL